MRWLLAAIGVVAALIFIAASGAMNYVFMSSQGKTVLEGQILGAVSVAVDIMKALLPFFIVYAWIARKVLFVTIGSCVFVLFLSFSLLSALGFAAGNRGATAGGREALTARYELVKTEAVELDSRISSLGTIQDARVAEAALSKLRQHYRWTSSKQCTDATARKSRNFCDGYFAKKKELAVAVSAARLLQRRSELRQELIRLKAKGAGQAADPQASLLARLIPGTDVGFMQRVLIILIAVMVELGAAFGLYLATGHSIKGRREVAQGRAGSKRVDESAARSLRVVEDVVDNTVPTAVITPMVIAKPPRPPRKKARARRQSGFRTDQPANDGEAPERFRLADAHALITAEK